MVQLIDPLRNEPEFQVNSTLPLSQNLLEIILEAGVAAFTVANADGQIIFANDAAEIVLGTPKALILQRTCHTSEWKITDFEDNPISDAELPFAQVMKTGKAVFNVQQAIESGTGKRRYLLVNGSPLKDSSGTITQVVFSFTNITDFIRLQQTQQASLVHHPTEYQQLELALQSQVEQDRLLEDVVTAIRQSLDLKVILQTSVNEVQKLLGVDRVIIYQSMGSGEVGSVVVESCAPDYPPLLGWKIEDSDTEQTQFVEPFQQMQNQVISDLSQCSLEPACKQLLQTFNVQSQITIPILHTAKIWGLLIVHQCASQRQWQNWEIAMLQRLETQLAVAIQQAEFHQQVQQLNLDLESQIQQRTIQLQKSLNTEAVLKHVTEKIHKTLDKKSILQTVVRELGLSLDLISCHASLYDLGQQTACVHHEYVNSGVPLQGVVTPIANYPEIYQFLFRGDCLQFCSTSIYPDSNPVSVLCCPIVDGERGVLGDLKLIAPKTHLFEQQDLQLVQHVAQQCAIAIRQSRLYQSAQAQIRKLEKLNQLQDDFLCTTSHELRTPLSSIKMAIQLMDILLRQSEQPLNSKIEHCLNILQEECDREINLINDLLLLQQLNAETHPFLASRVNLQDWLSSTLETFEKKFNSHQLSYQVDISPDIPPIVTDSEMFARVINELINNAYKFTPAGETVLFTARCLSRFNSSLKDFVEISVTNTGIEIPVDELPHVFNQFYRVPGNDPWKYSGTGLGLALVKKIVSFLGGFIQVTSGSGQTCFTIGLPLQRGDSTIKSERIHDGYE